MQVIPNLPNCYSMTVLLVRGRRYPSTFAKPLLQIKSLTTARLGYLLINIFGYYLYPQVMQGSTFLNISIVALLTLMRAALWSYLKRRSLRVQATYGDRHVTLFNINLRKSIVPSNSCDQDQLSFSRNEETTSQLSLTGLINHLTCLSGVLGLIGFGFLQPAGSSFLVLNATSLSLFSTFSTELVISGEFELKRMGNCLHLLNFVNFGCH